MAVDIQADTILAVVPEVTYGTAVTPATKFFPILSESLHYVQDTKQRRPVRGGMVEVLGNVAGYNHVEGDISLEAFHDIVPYFLHAARTSVVKTGTGPYTYAYTGGSQGIGSANPKSLTIYVSRNGQIFAYAGCSVTSFSFTIEDDLLVFNCSVVGLTEATNTLGTPAYTTTAPFGPGQIAVQIPTATPVFDVDGFDFSVNDNGEAVNRLKGTNANAQFVKYGERAVSLSLERDFDTRTDYDAFKALTSQSISIVCTAGANTLTILVPVTFKDSYEIPIGGQGDMMRASIDYIGMYDATTTAAYKVTIVTATENIT